MSGLDNLKCGIIARSIAEDQTATAEQWLKTFKSCNGDNPAYAIAKLMFACIAKGDFKTRSSLLKDNQWSAPSSVLKVVDYLSHASRIIVDYKNLSGENKAKFLRYFPSPHQNNKVVSRSATHAVIRDNNIIREQKGFMLGVYGQLSTFIKTPYDFGVNIAMGGVKNKNFVNKVIEENGFSGHIYFHQRLDHELVLVGLEQSAPTASIFDLFVHPEVKEENVQNGRDQFEQGHSLVGASDTYTAAGSIYFSDPVYIAKLLASHDCVAPDKYNSMCVTLTDENWELINQFLQALNHHVNLDDPSLALNQLLTAPASATNETQPVLSYVAIDFSTYLKRISMLLDEGADKAKHAALQKALLTSIHALKDGNKNEYGAFLSIIDEIRSQSNTSDAYKASITYLKVLFTKQLQIDPELNQIHNNLLLDKKSHELLISIDRLEAKAAMLCFFFTSELISKDDKINHFLSGIQQIKSELHTIKTRILMEDNSNVVDEHHLADSWSFLDRHLSLDELENHENTINSMDNFLQSPPQLFSNLSHELLATREAQFHEKIVNLESGFREAISRKQAKINALSREFEQKISEIQTRSKHNEGEILKNLNKDIVAMQFLNNDLKTELERFHGMQAIYQNQLSTANLAKTALENHLKEIEVSHLNNINRLSSQIEEIEAQLNASQHNMLFLETASRYKENHIAELNTTMRQMEATFDSEKANLQHQLQVQETLSGDLGNKVESLKNINAEQDRNIQKNDELYSENLAKITLEMAALEHKYNTSLETVADLQEQLLISNGHRDSLQDKLIKMDAERIPPVVTHSQETQTDLSLSAHQNALFQRTKLMAPILLHLDLIESKGEVLAKNNHIKAADAAHRLKENIEEEVNKFIGFDIEDIQQALKTFKTNCVKNIEKEASILKVHRGWGHVLKNIVACVLGLGAGYVIAGCINLAINKHFTFFNQTDSHKKIMDLQKSLDVLPLINVQA